MQDQLTHLSRHGVRRVRADRHHLRSKPQHADQMWKTPSYIMRRFSEGSVSSYWYPGDARWPPLTPCVRVGEVRSVSLGVAVAVVVDVAVGAIYFDARCGGISIPCACHGRGARQTEGPKKGRKDLSYYACACTTDQLHDRR